MIESRSVETPVTASLLTSVGRGKNLVDCSGAGGTRSVKVPLNGILQSLEVLQSCKALFTCQFSAPAGDVRLELSRNYRLPDLT